MPNLKDAEPGNSFLLIGPAGSGKTTQLLTMPGRKLALIFDPNALAALAGKDIDYELFIPEVVGRTLTPGGKKEVSAAGVQTSVQVYERFWTFMRNGIVNGDFDQYDSIMLDSLTGLTEVWKEKLVAQLNKPDWELEGREYGLLTREISTALRQITALKKNLLVTAHRKSVMDASGMALKSVEPELIGKSRAVVPTHFSNVFYTVANGNSTGVTYKFITRPNAMISEARPCLALAHIPADFDATIKDMSKPQDYGIGKLITDIAAQKKG